VKGLDAAIDFIRHRLLPQDFAAAFGYNRATDFTTDHEVIANVVGAVPRREPTPSRRPSCSTCPGLGVFYGSRGMPPAVQGRIDAVFAGPRAMAVHEDRGPRRVTPSDR